MRPLGLIELVTTTDIPSNAKTITSTSLADRFDQADRFIGQFVTVVLDADGGTPANGLGTKTRKVSAYTAIGELTYSGVQLSAEDEDVDCDLYLFHPDDILRAYNRARQDVFPAVGTVRDIETIVTGDRQHTFTIPSTIRRVRTVDLGQRYESGSIPENLLLNPDFEDWTNSTTPANWSLVGAGGSVNQEEATTDAQNYAVLAGNNSARLVVALNTVTTLLQLFDSQNSDYPAVATEGVECNVSAWVYCTTASRVSVRIAGNDGTAHGGTGWEYIKHSNNLQATASNVSVGIVASSGAAIPVFVDEVIMTLGPSEITDRPYVPLLNWDWVPSVNGASDGGKLYVREVLPTRHRLRIVGVDLLSSVAVDTDTVEVDGELLEPAYNKAREYLCQEAAERATGDRHLYWKRRQSEYRSKYDDFADNMAGLRLPKARMKIPTA